MLRRFISDPDTEVYTNKVYERTPVTPQQQQQHSELFACDVCRDDGERRLDGAIIPPPHTPSITTLSTYPALANLNTRAEERGDANDNNKNTTPTHSACVAYQNSDTPLNRRELGRASWAFLHTLAAYYPESPTPSEQVEMSQFVRTFAKLYPCGYCADMTANEMIRRPPRVENRQEFQLWMCGIHNEVNFRMGKPLFDCSKVDERWRTGIAALENAGANGSI